MSIFHELPRAAYPGNAFAQLGIPGTFAIGTARAAVWLSQLAYETRHPDKIADILAAWGLSGSAIAAGPEVSGAGATARGVAAKGHGAAFVALAGTDVLVPGDYLTDATVRLSATGTHLGFEAAALALMPAIERALTGFSGPLILTGHSLGGAMTAVLANHLSANYGIRPAAIYTFGMPRPGSPDFAANYNAQLGAVTYRLVHGTDPVSTVPPGSGYAHVGRLIRCDRKGRFVAANLATGYLPDEPPFVPRSAASLWQRVSGLLPSLAQDTARRDWVGQLLGHVPAAFADHFMDRYLEALDRSV